MGDEINNIDLAQNSDIGEYFTPVRSGSVNPILTSQK